jgi:ligand-binding SRPBCC domain-containing protein
VHIDAEALHPPALGFRILTLPPIVMASGTLIDYRLRLFGVPSRWRTRIEIFEPGVRFVDVQLSGRLWKHSHFFVPLGCQTLVVDAVVDYRRRRIAVLFGGEPPHG